MELWNSIQEPHWATCAMCAEIVPLGVQKQLFWLRLQTRFLNDRVDALEKFIDEQFPEE